MQGMRPALARSSGGGRPTIEPEKPPVPVQLFADSLSRMTEETAVPVAVTVTSDPFGGTVMSQE